MTLRDDTWNAVLVQLRKTGQFKISDLPFDESKRHTVRRVLREMRGSVNANPNSLKKWETEAAILRLTLQ